ncbi:MAG: beta-lactamase family protein, partial [Chloroflexota bacterium]|nr:beta-lactamase family protein [Chloroflexota bacterium]
MKRLLPLLAVLTVAASCVTSGNDGPNASQPSAVAAIGAYLAVLNDDNFSGAILVAKDFIPVASKATGYADRVGGAPAATITPFNIASVTKVFTAVAIGQLVDQGKVSLDDPLTKYLPAYPKPAGDQITIAMLLGQTAGTGDYLGDP